MGSIYKITNTINGKSYIGQTCHDAVKKRLNPHLAGNGNRILKKAIKKYGREAFTFEILHDSIIPEFLDDLEIEAIAKFNTLVPHGYNLTTGGNSGGSPSEETRRKISEANKGKTRTAEFRRKHSEAMKGEKNPNYGKTPSPETRRKISKANKGKLVGKPRSEETRERISLAQRGKIFSKEHRQNISRARLGIPAPNKGIPHSEEAKRKMSEVKKGKPAHNKGIPHSEEAKRKMSEAKKGKPAPNKGIPHSKETKAKISRANKGKPAHNKSPCYEEAHQFFSLLPPDMDMTEKRRLLLEKFSDVVHWSTIYRWGKKWS